MSGNPGLLFSVRKLCKRRDQGAGYALSVPALDIAPGEKIGITGPSGSGKSTILDMLGMALRPDGAERFFFQPDPACPPVDVFDAWRNGGQNRLDELRLRYMGYVLQTGGLLPFLTARANMELAARALGRPDRRAVVEELAARLGVERLLEVMPERLSVGERQRIAIGRALASRPRVILADEPTAALDPMHAGIVLELLLEAVEVSGITLILVTHDPNVVRRGGLRELIVSPQPENGGSVSAVLEDGVRSGSEGETHAPVVFDL